MNRWVYAALCAFVCVMPSLWIVGSLVLGTDTGYEDDMLFTGMSMLIAALLTYPAGAIGTIASWLMTASGLVTPAESVLVAAPVYVGAGYCQWYVLVPRYFRRAQQPAAPTGPSPADD